MKNAYIIFKANSEIDLAAGKYPYSRVAVYYGRTALDALARFAADRGIETTSGPAQGGYWFMGRKRLASFGKGQFHADLTTLPKYVEMAV